MKEKKLHLLLAVLATGMLSFSGVLIETAMNVTFPTLITEFSISTALVQWVTTIYLLVISIMVPFSNYLLKKFPIRWLFIAANLFFIAGLLIDFIAPSFMILLLGRLFQGISTGIALPLMFHIILNFAPMEKRGMMMGIGTLTTSIAPAIGPTYGGILTSALSWHYIFLFLIPLLIISLVAGLYAIPKISVQSTSKFDFPGFVGIALLFSGLLLFLSQMDGFSLIYLAVAAVGLILFYRRSKTAKDPLVSLKVLKNKGFRTFLFAFLVCQFLLLGVSFVLPNFVQIVLGKEAFVAGLVMLPGATVGALLAPISGRILDSIGPKKPITIGLAIATIGWGALTAEILHPFLLGFVAAHVFYMIGSGLSYSNIMTTSLSVIAKEDSGDANTIINTLQQFSGAVSTAIVASIIGFAQQSQSDYIVGTTLGSLFALLFLLILLVLAFVASFTYFHKQPKLEQANNS